MTFAPASLPAWAPVVATALAVLAMAATVVARLLRRERATGRRLVDALEQLATREREMRTLVDGVHELVLRTDGEGRVQFVSRRWQALTGRPGREAVGHRLDALVAFSDDADTRALFAPAPTGHAQARRARFTLASPPSGGRTFDLTLVPMAPDGSGFVGSAVDVTDLVVAQARHQEEARLNKVLLEASPLPISLVAPDGRLRLVNRAWESFHGLARQEVIGRPHDEVLPPSVVELVQVCEPPPPPPDAPADASAARIPATRCEVRLHAPGGDVRDALVTKVPVTAADGRRLGVLSVVMDITDFRRVERAAAQAQQVAEDASRAKSTFIANISHELRTPLQSILGFSELGLVRGTGHPRLAAMFQDILQAGQRMLALVEDLLDLARIENPLGALHFERHDLAQVVRSLARELDPLLQARGLRLTLAMPEVLPAEFDRQRIEQLLRNVLANAIRFSPEGGAISLAARREDDASLAIAVRDSGPGIPPAELEAIFEPFVQSSRTSDGSGGTGLGLAICRQIVQAHGGQILAANRTGGGARIEVRLPPCHRLSDFADTGFPDHILA